MASNVTPKSSGQGKLPIQVGPQTDIRLTNNAAQDLQASRQAFTTETYPNGSLELGVVWLRDGVNELFKRLGVQFKLGQSLQDLDQAHNPFAHLSSLPERVTKLEKASGGPDLTGNSVSALEGRVSKLETQVTNSDKNTTKTINENKEEIKKEIESLKKQLQALTNQPSARADQSGQANDPKSLTNLLTRLEGLSEFVGRQATKQDNSERALTHSEERYSTLLVSVENQKKRLTALENNKPGSNEELEEIQKSLEAEKKRLNDTKGEVYGLQTFRTTTITATNDLKTRLDNQDKSRKEEIASLKNLITVQNERLTLLETQLKGAKSSTYSTCCKVTSVFVAVLIGVAAIAVANAPAILEQAGYKA